MKQITGFYQYAGHSKQDLNVIKGMGVGGDGKTAKKIKKSEKKPCHPAEDKTVPLEIVGHVADVMTQGK